MKITMDKDMTESYMVDRTKAQMKEFKMIYSDSDLLRMFADDVNRGDLMIGYKILQCDLRAFPGGSRETDETHYCVEMTLKGWREYVELYFYISQSGELSTEPRWIGNAWLNMYDITTYKQV